MAILTFGTFQIQSIRVYRFKHDGLGDITKLVIWFILYYKVYGIKTQIAAIFRIQGMYVKVQMPVELNFMWAQNSEGFEGLKNLKELLYRFKIS